MTPDAMRRRGAMGLVAAAVLIAPAGLEAQSPPQAVNVVQLGADPHCGRDSTAAFRRALAAGGQIYVPAGVYCLNTPASTLVVGVDGTVIYGDGRRSLIKWNAPPGTPIAPILDVKAQNVTVHDIAFDGNAEAGNYIDNVYFGTANPWGDATVILEGRPKVANPNQLDNIKLYNVWAANGFDNCIAAGAINPATNQNYPGRPLGATLDHIQTADCGVGVHGGGVHGGPPGRIGFGIDNGSGQMVTISNAVDDGSYDGFGDDIGAAAMTTFRNITSNSPRVDPAHPTNGSGLGLYIGSQHNTVENLTIRDAGGNAMWVDYYAWPITMTNIVVEGAAENCLILKNGATIHGLTCENVARSVPNRFHAIWVDSSYAPTGGPLTITGLHVRGGQPATTVTVTGKFPVTGDIEADSLPGSKAPVSLPAESRDTLRVHTPGS